MNLDRTFCSGLRCKRREECERWIRNMEAEAKRRGISLEGRRISMAQFADHDGKCDNFIQKKAPACDERAERKP